MKCRSQLVVLLCCLCGPELAAQQLPTDQVKRLEAMALEHLGPDPATAVPYVDSLCGAKPEDPIEHEARCGYLRAALLARNGQLREAWDLIQEVDALAVRDTALLVHIKNFLGRIAYDNDEFEVALEAFHDGLALIGTDDPMRQAVTYNNLGRLYERLKEYDKAFEAIEKSIAIYEHLGDEQRLAGSLVNLGVLYFDRKEFAAAEECFEKGIAHAQSAGLDDIASIALESLANTQRETGKYKEALVNYGAAMAISEENGSLEGQASISRNMGQLQLAQGDPSGAIPYFLRTLQVADSMDSRNYRMDAHFYLYKAFKEKNSFPEAMAHLEEYLAVRENILSEEKNKAIAAWQVRTETAEKERTILEQEVRIEKDQLALEQQGRNMRYSLGGIFLLVALIGLLVRDRSRSRKMNRIRMDALEQEKRLEAMRAMLAGEERERQRVAGELHDGIGVLLSAARMHVETKTFGGDRKAGTLLAEVADEVRRISHNLMPGTLAKLGLIEALHELAAELTESGALHTELHVKGNYDRLPVPVEVGLYRIVQETLHNTAKHAGAGRAMITLSTSDREVITLRVEDDGKGFDPKEGMHGNGTGNIRARAAMLGGRAELHTAKGKGTVWQIEVPVPLTMESA